MKAKTFWLAVDDAYISSDMIWVYPKKPKYIDKIWEGMCVEKFCNDMFKRLTGIAIKPGECRKFRLVEVE